MDPRVIRVRLELEPNSDPIAGRAIDVSGRVCAFSNWLTLIAVLEDLRERATSVDRPSVSST